MKKISVAALVLLLACAAVLWLLQRPSPPPLFAEVPADAATASSADRDLAKRVRFVRLNEKVVSQLAQANSEVRLNFFKGDAPTALIERTEENINQSITSYGTLKDMPHSQVILVAGGGTLAGSVMMPDGRMYLISHASDGIHKILEVANEKLPDCDAGRNGDVARRSEDGKAVMAFQSTSSRTSERYPATVQRVNLRMRTSSSPTATTPVTPVVTTTVPPVITQPTVTPPTNTTTVTAPTKAVTKAVTAPTKATPTKAGGSATIDILVVYTPQAKADHGGKSGAENMITTAAAQANTALKNSKINATIRVVHMAEVTYTEGAGVADDLAAVTDGSTPALQQVHQLRLQYKADLVTLFTAAHGASSVGVGWLMPGQAIPDNGYNVVELQAAPMLTFIHETGHGLGCNHTKDGGSAGAFPYSFGHRFKPTDLKAPSSDYRTVMAYAPGVRVPYFSNPSVSYYGTATGVTDDADNARTINQTASIVAAYSDTLAAKAASPTQGNDNTASRPATGAK